MYVCFVFCLFVFCLFVFLLLLLFRLFVFLFVFFVFCFFFVFFLFIYLFIFLWRNQEKYPRIIIKYSSQVLRHIMDFQFVSSMSVLNHYLLHSNISSTDNNYKEENTVMQNFL